MASIANIKKLAYENHSVFLVLSVLCAAFILVFDVFDVCNIWGNQLPSLLKIASLAIPFHALFTCFYREQRQLFDLSISKACAWFVSVGYIIHLSSLVRGADISYEYLFVFCLYGASVSRFLRLPFRLNISTCWSALTVIYAFSGSSVGARTSHPYLLVAALLLIQNVKIFLAAYKP